MAVFASQVRLLIAALLVCVFTLTPAASAAHDKAENEHTCELIIVSPDVSPAEDTESEHEHHAHKCGSCHVHLAADMKRAHFPAPALIGSQFIILAEDLNSRPPGNPYRPPRV